MAGVTGFATGMIAGALWLVFFIGLGLTARKSPGHPLKSIRRFRSSTKSLDLDVPSALKPPPPSGSSEVRIVNPGATIARNTGEWEQPRSPRDRDPWDEPRPKQSPRQFQRPTLRPVPDLPEPTVQMDTTTFFEPEHPRTRPRPVRQEAPPYFEAPQSHPTLIGAEMPSLLQASAHSGSGGFGGGEVGGGRMSHQSRMSASNQPPQRPSEPPRGPDPGYPTSPGFAPESFPQPGPQGGAPSLPAFPPPEPFEEPRQGRFGKKGRTKADKAPKPEKAPKPAAAAPAPPAPPVPPAAAQEKAKKEKKKGLFKAPSKPKQAAQPAVPPPPVPPIPAVPPKPRFTAPFNYTPPSSTPPATPPTYRTTSATGPANRSPWTPPASFKPPASPSFGNWGPKPAEPPPAAQSTPPATPPGEPFVPPGSPFLGNGNRNGLKGPEEPAPESGKWPFGLSASGAAEAGTPHRDPELPAYIELSMFQDPTSADDIAAEQDSESEHPEAEAGEPAESAGSQEAWLSDEAWPAPKESRRKWKRDPWPTEDIPSVEENRLLEQHWPQETPQPEEAAVTDWTSADTPWPGETRRPAEPTWATDPPAAESQQAPQQWGEESWQHEARPSMPEPAAEQRWTHREPSAEQPATDPWVEERTRRAAAQPVAEPWGQESDPRPAPEPQLSAPERQESRRSAPEVPAEDPWVQSRVRQSEPAPLPAEPPVVEQRAPAEPEAEPPSNGRRIFVDDEEDWKPLSIDVNLDEDIPPFLDPVIEAAARLKAAETAIKVENGLAYVLVDDEGRPVLR